MRALRRHHRDRIVLRRWKRVERGSWFVKSPGYLAKNNTVCSCWMCGNPRRYFCQLTRQEILASLNEGPASLTWSSNLKGCRPAPQTLRPEGDPFCRNCVQFWEMFTGFFHFWSIFESSHLTHQLNKTYLNQDIISLPIFWYRKCETSSQRVRYGKEYWKMWRIWNPVDPCPSNIWMWSWSRISLHSRKSRKTISQWPGRWESNRFHRWSSMAR